MVCIGTQLRLTAGECLGDVRLRVDEGIRDGAPFRSSGTVKIKHRANMHLLQTFEKRKEMVVYSTMDQDCKK